MATNAMSKSKNKPPLPMDIKLSDDALLAEGTVFVVLRTLNDLEIFWRDNEDKFEFACEGIGWQEQVFLREYEWVFGTSKAGVVRTVMRWDQLGVGCDFYNWAKDDPIMYSAFFEDRDLYRKSQIQNGSWSAYEEETYWADCSHRSPKTYSGWWRLKNLPIGFDDGDWFNPFIVQEELIDPKMPIEVVSKKLQEQTFDDWMQSDLRGIKYHDRASIEETISYWKSEKESGSDYYGSENE